MTPFLRILLHPTVSGLLLVSTLSAQVVVEFSVDDPGEKKNIPNWGLDTNWADYNNMVRGLSFMGTTNVNVVRLPGLVESDITNGLPQSQKDHLSQAKAIAALATSADKFDLCAPGSDVGAWFNNGSGFVHPDRWAASLKLCQEYYNLPFWLVEPFNEPDYAPWNEGSKENLYDIMGLLKGYPNFADSIMAGGSTMSTDPAAAWFDAMKGRAGAGTVHCLYGSETNYIDFITHVKASGAIPVNPEGHNVVEAIVGAEYGLDTLIWWGTAERARGDFLKASDGVRLGYGEDRVHWTAAAVYKRPDGAIQAFLGSAERVGAGTIYTFRSKDKDVYFDGHGPQREYSVTIRRNQERVVNITSGPDPAPVPTGRFALMNVKSGLCIEIINASMNQGSTLVQGAYTGAAHQLWNLADIPSTKIGDLSYITLQNVNSLYYADVPEWTMQPDAPIKQYNYPDNHVEHWYFEYAGDGKGYIRSHWSNQYLAVKNGDKAIGATVVQHPYTGGDEQLWMLVDPASAPKSSPLAFQRQPQAATAAPGQSLSFTAQASGTGRVTYQWYHDGVAIEGATGPHLLLQNVGASDAGSYTVAVSDAVGSLTSTAATLTVKTTQKPGHLINLSVRSNAGTGAQTLITGFYVTGNAAAKKLVIRGIGPTLRVFNLDTALNDPELHLYRDQTLLTSGTAWGGSSEMATLFAKVGAFALPADSLDAALAPSLAAGAYTAHLTSVSGANGVALVELYDAEDAASFDIDVNSRLANLSARTQVGTGADVLITGFAIGGDTSCTVLIRGVGPSLGLFGITGTLANPKLELISGETVLDANTGWGGDAQISATSQKVGAFPLASGVSKDATILFTLQPGTYSAKISGADGGTGVALAEVYELR